jgi:hypothetical protein
MNTRRARPLRLDAALFSAFQMPSVGIMPPQHRRSLTYFHSPSEQHHSCRIHAHSIPHHTRAIQSFGGP